MKKLLSTENAFINANILHPGSLIRFSIIILEYPLQLLYHQEEILHFRIIRLRN